ELRRNRVDAVDPEFLERALADADRLSAGPDRGSDPMLRRAIEECRRLLPRKPAAAIEARIDSGGGEPDAVLAERVRMRRNTCLQNITRARRLLADCLRRRGIDLALELAWPNAGRWAERRPEPGDRAGTRPCAPTRPGPTSTRRGASRCTRSRGCSGGSKRPSTRKDSRPPHARSSDASAAELPVVCLTLVAGLLVESAARRGGGGPAGPWGPPDFSPSNPLGRPKLLPACPGSINLQRSPKPPQLNGRH